MKAGAFSLGKRCIRILGPKDQIEGTYIGMMMHNTQAIVQGLGGTMTAASTALIPVL